MYRFQRTNKFLQIDDLLSQEASYLKILVARIAALKPDWVLVTNTISRLAQDYLLEAGIGFALHVKHNVLKRLARATGADVLDSATGNTF